MVAKKGVKKKSVGRKCRTHDRKLLALVIGIFVLALVALNFTGVDNSSSVSVTGNVITGQDILERPEAGSLGASIVDFVDGVVTTMNPLTKYVLGDTKELEIGEITISAASVLFIKFIFFMFLLGIFYLVLNNVDFFSDSWVMWVISIGGSILGVRLLSNPIIGTILLPYTALGILVLTVLPFICAFLLIEKGMAKSPKQFRKVLWAIFGIIYVFLWGSFDFGTGNWLWFYPVVAFLSFLMLKLDGTIQKFWINTALEKAKNMNKAAAYKVLTDALKSIDADFVNDGTAYQSHHTNVAVSGKKAYEADKKEINARIKSLLK